MPNQKVLVFYPHRVAENRNLPVEGGFLVDERRSLAWYVTPSCVKNFLGKITKKLVVVLATSCVPLFLEGGEKVKQSEIDLFCGAESRIEGTRAKKLIKEFIPPWVGGLSLAMILLTAFLVILWQLQRGGFSFE